MKNFPPFPASLSLKNFTAGHDTEKLENILITRDYTKLHIVKYKTWHSVFH